MRTRIPRAATRSPTATWRLAGLGRSSRPTASSASPWSRTTFSLRLSLYLAKANSSHYVKSQCLLSLQFSTADADGGKNMSVFSPSRANTQAAMESFVNKSNNMNIVEGGVIASNKILIVSADIKSPICTPIGKNGDVMGPLKMAVGLRHPGDHQQIRRAVLRREQRGAEELQRDYPLRLVRGVPVLQHRQQHRYHRRDDLRDRDDRGRQPRQEQQEQQV